MKLDESSSEITIRHTPIGRWISGGILAFIFGGSCLWLIYYLIFGVRNYFESVETDGFAFFVVGVIIVLFAVIETKLISMICAPKMTITINRETKSINIQSRRFYGSKTQRFYFSQIKKFKSYKGRRNFSSEYFLALVLANQKLTKLEIPVGGDKQNTIKLVKKLNKFVRTQMTSVNSPMI